MRKNRKSFVLRYTLLFLLISGLVFSPFAIAGKSFVNRTDAMTQYLVYLRYMGQYLRDCLQRILSGSFSFPAYDFSIGLGDDIGQIVRFHPLDFLSVIVPSRYTEQLYAVILFLRLYLSGLAFGIFASYWRSHTPEGITVPALRPGGASVSALMHEGVSTPDFRSEGTLKHEGASTPASALWTERVNTVNILSGAMVYVFGGYMLIRVLNHPTYAAPFIVFPLLLTGAEKVMRREGMLLFPAMVFLGFWSNYYFMYIMSWGLLVYVIVRFADLYHKERVKTFFALAVKMMLLYLTGLCMSFATLLPTMLRYGASIRSSASSAGMDLFIYSDKRRYFAWFLNLISPYRSSGNGVNLNFAVVVFPCLVLLFLLPWKIHRALKLFLIVQLCVLLIPAAGSLLAVFNRENSRWMFLPALALGMCVVFTVDSVGSMTRRTWMILCAAAAVFLLGVAGQTVRFGLNLYNIVGAAELCAALFVIWLVQKRDVKVIRAGILLLTCISCVVNGYLTYSPSFGGVTGSYCRAGNTLSRYEKNLRTQFARKVEDPSFFRIEAYDVRHVMDNCAEYGDFNGTTEYNSILNASMIDAMELENNKDLNAITTMHGMDARPVMLNLAHVRYFLTGENGAGAVPYGFTEDISYSLEDAKVYRCDVPLSFGYSYDSFITRKNFEALSPLEREMVQLYAAVVDEEDASGLNQVKALQDAGLKEITGLPYEILEERAQPSSPAGLAYEDGKVQVTQKKGSFTIEADEREGYECYVSLDGLRSDRVITLATVETDNVSSRVWLRNEQELYNLGREDYLVRLGYSDTDAPRSVKITLRDPGEYSLSGVRVLYVPMQDYEDAISRLNEDSLEQESVEDQEVKGEITLTEPKLVVFSVPWADGWTLEADGETTLPGKANVMYLSALLDQGTHQIRLVYKTPGAAAGLCVSVCGIAVWVLLAAWSRRKKRSVS